MTQSQQDDGDRGDDDADDDDDDDADDGDERPSEEPMDVSQGTRDVTADLFLEGRESESNLVYLTYDK